MSNQEQEVTEAAAQQSAPEPDVVVELDLAGQLAAVAAERDKFAAEAAELRDRALRFQADHQNFRRRTERDRSEYIAYAAMETVRELLPILDDFERALKSECGDKDFVKGVELIYQRLLDTLKKGGLEPMDTASQRFDPHQHQAVEMVEISDDTVEDHTIVGEFQRGYNFKGRLLRPAMVKVAVKRS